MTGWNDDHEGHCWYDQWGYPHQCATARRLETEFFEVHKHWGINPTDDLIKAEHDNALAAWRKHVEVCSKDHGRPW